MHDNEITHSFCRSVAEATARLGIQQGDSIGVALSGGADSVALLAALGDTGCNVVALHCNFSLRGDESDGDTLFCRTLCNHLHIPLHEIRFDTLAEQLSGESVEMTCRRLRYDWFAEMHRALHLSAIAIAHHREDSIETALLNMLRGSGPRGVAGIAPRRGIFIRPMLDLTRRQIEEYLAAKEIDFRTDSSNLANDYRRNALRNVIIPEIRSRFPEAERGILNTMEAMRLSQDLIDEYLHKIRRKCVDDSKIDIATLCSLTGNPASILYLLSKDVWGEGLSKTTVAEILRKPSASGRMFATRDGINVELSHGILIPHDSASAADSRIEVEIGKDIDLPVTIKSEVMTPQQFATSPRDSDTIYLDAGIITPGRRFFIRPWRDGDRLKPFGMKGTRKLSDIFSDMHLPLKEKAHVKILTCIDTPGHNDTDPGTASEEILWVIGIRASRLHSVTPLTASIIQLRVES